MERSANTGWRLAGAALAWLAGVALQLQQQTLWSVSLSIAAVVLGAVALCVALRWRRALAVGLVGAALLGFGASAWRASLRLVEELPTALEGRDIRVTGTVASLPQRSAAGLRFRFDVDAAQLDGQAVQVPSLLALGWYSGWHEDAALTQPQTELRAGQRWSFTLRLRQPHGNLNPHGFDYELQLFEQGVRATGAVRDAPAPVLLHAAAGHPVERLRQRVRDAIETSVPTAAPPVCWPRSRSATRARSSVKTGTSTATPVWPTWCRSAVCTSRCSPGSPAHALPGCGGAAAA
jgi:competence protein ComEC